MFVGAGRVFKIVENLCDSSELKAVADLVNGVLAGRVMSVGLRIALGLIIVERGLADLPPDASAEVMILIAATLAGRVTEGPQEKDAASANVTPISRVA